MIPRPPILLFTFANDPAYSLQLEAEERMIRERLQDGHDARKFEYHSLGATTLDDIYQTFNRFHNRIHLFHFSGHSDHQFLSFRDERSRAANLSVQMGMQQNLKLVVLNGCANREQVEAFFAKGVRAVIATHSTIADDRALQFSKSFYDALRNGKTIRESFESAKAQLNERYPDIDLVFRGQGLEADTEEKLPWGLFAQQDADLDWAIPDPFAIPEDLDYFTEVELINPDTNKAFIESVFEGMAKLNRKYRFLWEDYLDEASGDTKIYDLQESIYNRFPSLLSVQIRDLFTENAKRKGRLRLTELLEIYIVLGKLLCAIAMADLWGTVIRRREQGPEKRLRIRSAYRREIKNYLQQRAEDSDRYDHFWLLATIGRIFAENDHAPFIDELKDLSRLLANDHTLYDAYQFLEFELKQRVLANNIASREVAELCERGEKSLGILLNHCAFLITYQLVSVNDISVQKLIWSPETSFVHNKVLLRGVEDTSRDRDPQLRKNFTCNHVVVVTKDFRSEDEPLILMPFLLDENAYKIRRKEQSKIHFFAGKTSGGNIKYQHAEVLSDGFELPPDGRNIYRQDDLEKVAALYDQLVKDLELFPEQKTAQ
jgi:hypothetical protein